MRASHPDPGDIQACLDVLRAGSASFHMAGLLLPRRVRDHAGALYAFCRLADDVADVGRRREGLDVLRRRLQDAYAGYPRADPIDRAFAAVVALHDVPKALPEALIEGLAWDIEGRDYETLADLEAYAARVAGSVGAMMAIVMGVREEEAVARACDLGVAMQLTNIARDVGEDARMGRLYLPRRWLREEGIDPDAWLARPQYTEGMARSVRRLLAAAAVLYDRAAPGIAHLPLGCRTGIHAARLIYADIGRLVARSGFDAVEHRAVVPHTRKLRLVMRAAACAGFATNAPARPPLDSTRGLVAAVARATPRRSPPEPAGRIVWLLALFERLERQERT